MEFAHSLMKNGQSLPPSQIVRLGCGAVLYEYEALCQSSEGQARITISEGGPSKLSIDREARQLPLRLGQLSVSPGFENSQSLLEQRARGARIPTGEQHGPLRHKILGLPQRRLRDWVGRLRHRVFDFWRFSLSRDLQRERLYAAISVADDLGENSLGAVALRFGNSPGFGGGDGL